jgi:hypothetical protein
MSREKPKVSLSSDDWDILFKTKDYSIGKTVLRISPLSLEELIDTVKTFASIQGGMEKLRRVGKEGEGSTVEEIAALIKNEAPAILSTMSGLDAEDVRSLPLVEVVKLFNVCVDLNLEAQEDLIKNLQALNQKMSSLTSGAQSVMPSKS